MGGRALKAPGSTYRLAPAVAPSLPIDRVPHTGHLSALSSRQKDIVSLILTSRNWPRLLYILLGLQDVSIQFDLGILKVFYKFMLPYSLVSYCILQPTARWLDGALVIY